jgi:hypothetical protein
MIAVIAKASWSIEGAKELSAAEYERKFAKLLHTTPGVPGDPKRPHRSFTEERNARASANRIGIVRWSRELCSDMRGKESIFNAMAVACVRKPEFTSRVDSSRDLTTKIRDLAMKIRDLASGPGARASRNGLEPWQQVGLIESNADPQDSSEVNPAETR